MMALQQSVLLKSRWQITLCMVLPIDLNAVALQKRRCKVLIVLLSERSRDEEKQNNVIR